MEFSEPGIFNYSTLLLSEDKAALYVGAREAIFELSMTNVTIRNNKVHKRCVRMKLGGETFCVWNLDASLGSVDGRRNPYEQVRTEGEIKRGLMLYFYLFWFILSLHVVNMFCWLSEGLSELHPGAPSFRRWAAVRLRDVRLSASVWSLGRLLSLLWKPTWQKKNKAQTFASFLVEPWWLFVGGSDWRRQREVLLWPVTKLHHGHGWWVRGLVLFSLLVASSSSLCSQTSSSPLDSSDGDLYSGTAYNFLGSEPIISRYSQSHYLLRTEYSTSWLNGKFDLNKMRKLHRIELYSCMLK